MTYDVRTLTAMRATGQRKAAPTISVEPPEWTLAALCQQFPAEMFFLPKGGSALEPKKLCMRCEVRDECLTFAMAAETITSAGEPASATLRHGVYGGLTPRERARLSLDGWKPADGAPPVVLREPAGAAAIRLEEPTNAAATDVAS